MFLTRIAIWATPSWMIFVVRILSDSHFWCGSLRLFTFPFEMAVRIIVPRNIIGEWMFGLVDGFKHGFYFPYEMSSFALTKSYFSRWLSHHQPENIGNTQSVLIWIIGPNLIRIYETPPILWSHICDEIIPTSTMFPWGV
jgi:hypothetical protein